MACISVSIMFSTLEIGFEQQAVDIGQGRRGGRGGRKGRVGNEENVVENIHCEAWEIRFLSLAFQRSVYALSRH